MTEKTHLNFMLMKIVNLLMFVLMVLMNYLANALPLNNKTTGEISAQYPNLFVPAGITFSIWGVIYLLLFGFIIFQFFGYNKEKVNVIGWAFALSCLFNATWIIAWHYDQLPVSLLLMTGLLITLIFINIKLQPYAYGLTKVAFGIYLGGICIATIANITALLVSYDWGGWGISQETWAILMILAGTAITALALMRMNNPFVGLAVIWAFIGIIIKRQVDYPLIVGAAIVGIVVMAIFSVWMFAKGNAQNV